MGMTVTLIVASGGAIAFLLTFLAALIRDERKPESRISLKSKAVGGFTARPAIHEESVAEDCMRHAA